MALFINIYGYFLFANFKASDACQASSATLWVNIVTTIIILFFFITLYLKYNKNNNMLTMSLVSLYIAYLSIISQFSYPNENSNQIQCKNIDIKVQDSRQTHWLWTLPFLHSFFYYLYTDL
jgi:amino acid permease